MSEKILAVFGISSSRQSLTRHLSTCSKLVSNFDAFWKNMDI